MSARAFMRYADARMAEHENGEIYRIYVAEHLRALVGTELHLYDLTHGADSGDFDAEQVVDYVIARMGLEEELE